MITLQSIVRRRKEILAADLDGETVMMSVEAGKYYNLGEIGGAIWRRITESVVVEDLVAQLLEEYNVAQGQCESDTLAFLEKLKQEGLLEPQCV